MTHSPNEIWLRAYCAAITGAAVSGLPMSEQVCRVAHEYACQAIIAYHRELITTNQPHKRETP